MIERDSCLLGLSQYVVLNPVRAAVVEHTMLWPWSSYHATVGAAPRPQWLQTDWLLSQFGAQPARQIQGYVEFVQQSALGFEVWSRVRGQVYLGGDEFVEAMQKRLDEDQKFAS